MSRLLGGEPPIENKTPRAYQAEILQVCQKRNAIIRLDTGMGKTFIAIMLMKYKSSLPMTDSAHKLIVFLVPTVPLVIQQSTAIANNTSLRVRAYHGDMNVDLWDKGRWLAEFHEADCIVLTAQIFLNLLKHAYWSLENVTLLVFDECHHCQKGHPYKQIMDEFHLLKTNLPSTRLPQILGLTASPIHNPTNPEAQFRQLEANLHAILVTIRESTLEAAGYFTKPKERALFYADTTHAEFETDFESQLEELEIWDYVKEDKVRNRIENVKRTLGPLACDIYIMHWLWSLRDPVATKDSLHRIRASGRIPDIVKLHQAMQQHIERLDFYSLGDVSDKVKELVKLLCTYKDKPQFHCIVFVQQRHHAQALATLIQKSQSLQSFIRASYLVGHGSSGEERLNSEGMDARKQHSAVEKFRTGELNLLCATQVAEEGLDFQACNLIIRFDNLTTFKGYVQSRGRARKKDSEFVVMIKRDTDEYLRYTNCIGHEEQLEKLYNQRLPDDEPEEPELENTPRYTVPETGATLTYGTAIALLGEVCSLLPTDAYSPTSRPRYELNDLYKIYKCKVCLPMMPALPPSLREIWGIDVPTKKGAKQAAAFEACKVLHEYGILDPHLLALREGKGDLARDADDELVDRTVPDLLIEVDQPNIFGNMWASFSPTVWLNEVQVHLQNGTKERFGFICGERLDLEGPLPMHEPGCQHEVYVKSVRRLSWSEAERKQKLNKLDTLTRWVIKQVINQKLIRGNMLYLLAPLAQNSAGAWDIDWSVVEQPYRHINSLSQLSPGNLIVAPWQFMRKHIFTIHDIREDLNSDNMPRITGLTKRGRIFERTNSFGDALIALLDYENIDMTGLDRKEAMLHLKPWFRVRNNLNPIKESKKERASATAPDGTGADRNVASAIEAVDEIAHDDDIPLAPWEIPDWKWRKYQTKQHAIDEEAMDMVDPEDSMETLQALPAGHTTASHKDVTNAFVLPWSLCKISNIPIGVWNAWSWLPSLTRAIHDQARVQYAMRELKLPTLQFPLVAQALTMPMCCIGKDYQTLETIGDSALKLAVTVLVYNRFHSKDEGGLSARRMNSIDNQHLRLKALKRHLPQHIFTEFFKMRTWVPTTLENGGLSEDASTFRKAVPRRALSDCIEALLGAAYLSGGFEAVLQTGTALGLCFGGPDPWHERYALTKDVLEAPVGPGLQPLEALLGYKFKHGQLLMQALTHRSFVNASTHCQEREEFLGDAVLDNFVIDRLSRRFPTATPSHLTRLRATLVSNSALGYLALKFLGLHRYIMHATPLLNQHFERALEEAQQLIHDNFVEEVWMFDPPKPAADSVEGIIGSIFIDCGWKVEPVYEVLDRIFENMFKLLPHKESAPRDPTSRLRLWLQQRSCRDIEIKAAPRPDIHLLAVVTVTWHGRELANVQHHSPASAKQLASKISLDRLRAGGDEYVKDICQCDDEQHERLAPIREWKKELDAQLKAMGMSKSTLDIDRSMDPYMGAVIKQSHTSAPHLDIINDLASDKEADLEAKEQRLEQIMRETYGFNPERPEPGEGLYNEDDVAEEDEKKFQALAPDYSSNEMSSVVVHGLEGTRSAVASVPLTFAGMSLNDTPNSRKLNGVGSATKLTNVVAEQSASHTIEPHSAQIQVRPTRSDLLIDFSDDEDDDQDKLIIRKLY